MYICLVFYYKICRSEILIISQCLIMLRLFTLRFCLANQLVMEPRAFNRRQMGALSFMDVPRGKLHAESIWLGAIDAQGSKHPQNGDFKMAAVANLKNP